MYESESDASIINQLDGNVSVSSNVTSVGNDIQHKQIHKIKPTKCKQKPILEKKQDKISIAHNLPTVASYNLRSLLPKKDSLITDILERSVQCAFLQEI